MLNIEEKSAIYESQLSKVQSRLSEFGNSFNWGILNRGRKPNAGVYGRMGSYNVSIQIESIEVDWNRLPEEIFPDMEFSIWCGISNLLGEKEKLFAMPQNLTGQAVRQAKLANRSRGVSPLLGKM